MELTPIAVGFGQDSECRTAALHIVTNECSGASIAREHSSNQVKLHADVNVRLDLRSADRSLCIGSTSSGKSEQ